MFSTTHLLRNTSADAVTRRARHLLAKSDSCLALALTLHLDDGDDELWQTASDFAAEAAGILRDLRKSHRAVRVPVQAVH